MYGNVIIQAKSAYGRDKIFHHGNEYTYVKIVEHYYNGDFLIMIKSNYDDTKILLKLETDEDFIIKFFNETDYVKTKVDVLIEKYKQGVISGKIGVLGYLG